MRDGFAYEKGYSYNAAGLKSAERYPTGREVLSNYDEAGRIVGVSKQATGLYYVGAATTETTNRIKYTPHGAVSAMRVGNSLWEHTSFNSRMQPVEIGLGATATSTSLLGLTFGYSTLVPASSSGFLHSTQLTTRLQYDIAGNVVSATDPRNFTTSFDFSDRFGSPDGETRLNNQFPPELASAPSFALAARVTTPASHIAYTQFDFYTAKPVDSEDPNWSASQVE